MTFSMRHYQTEFHNGAIANLSNGSTATLGVMATGLGKTVSAAWAAEHFHATKCCRTLFLAHREELIHQAARTYAAVHGSTPDIEMGQLRADQRGWYGKNPHVIASIQTLCREKRHSAFNPQEFGLIVWDECFPAGTSVDGSAIEEIRQGDLVSSFSHATGEIEKRKVVKTFKSRPCFLVSIHLKSGREITCTSGHPFFIADLNAYVPAYMLSQGMMLSTINKDSSYAEENRNKVFAMRENLRRVSECSIEERQKSLLWSGLLSSGDGGKESSDCTRENAFEESYVSERYSSQGINFSQSDGMEAQSSGRQWSWADSSGTTSRLCFGMADECFNLDRFSVEGIPYSLQGGYCQQGIEDCDRSRWQQSQTYISQRTGQEKNRFLGVDWVDSVEIYQPTSGDRFAELCPDGFVYNLEIEGNHNYFVEGVLVHNCHHACPNRNKSYNKIFEHFRQNDNIKHLGITATPDRADEEALGGMFDSVIKFQRDGKEFEEYGILQGIHDGWLVEIDQEFIEVEGLDVSKVRKSGADLNEGDLAAIMDEDKILHRILAPTYEAAAGRPCIIFMPPRKKGDHGQSPSEKAADILNGYRKDCARFLSGNPREVTPEQREVVLKGFRGGDIQFLVNCAVAIEGFDAPNTAVIAMARLTSSRSFYAQAIGRGTRPLRDIVPALNAEPDPSQRRSMIANSAKAKMLVLDFCGNSGKHKLISSADVLGGNYSDDVVERAKQNAKNKGHTRTEEELQKAEEQIKQEQRKRRQSYIAKATFSRTRIDPFAYSDTVPTREPGWHRGRKPSDKQVAFLANQGVEKAEEMSFWEASQMIGECVRWRNEGLATFKQRRLISKFGYDPNVKFAEASAIITNLKNNGWQRKDW